MKTVIYYSALTIVSSKMHRTLLENTRADGGTQRNYKYLQLKGNIKPPIKLISQLPITEIVSMPVLRRCVSMRENAR